MAERFGSKCDRNRGIDAPRNADDRLPEAGIPDMVADKIDQQFPDSPRVEGKLCYLMA